MRHLLPMLTFAVLAACTLVPAERPAPERIGKTSQGVPQQSVALNDDRIDPWQAVRNFRAAVEAIEPVAEEICRARAPQSNCDFQIVVDDAVNAPPNAFQTVDETGRPIIVFTVPLIAETRNRDELAFILAHEAAHHILGHLGQQRRNASIGASVFGWLVSIGNDTQTVRTAQQIGAELGARTYSKDFELEADALGTEITVRAGFDALRGAAFFFRIPDPGNTFLGTHPANADRLRTVEQVAARMGA